MTRKNKIILLVAMSLIGSLMIQAFVCIDKLSPNQSIVPGMLMGLGIGFFVSVVIKDKKG